MKSRPILFSSPMVRALLDGRKSQTRRVLKQATGPSLSADCSKTGQATLSWLFGDGPGYPVMERLKFIQCPYGQPGDQILVKETYFAFGRWVTRFNTKKGRDEWHFVDMTLDKYIYNADTPDNALRIDPRRDDKYPNWWKRPAIFMPRVASRITLEITGVRIERLQDISEADALAEGVWTARLASHADSTKSNMGATLNHIGAYRKLWDSINSKSRPMLPHNTGSKRYARVKRWLETHPDTTSWDANPWVWVISFRRV